MISFNYSDDIIFSQEVKMLIKNAVLLISFFGLTYLVYEFLVYNTVNKLLYFLLLMWIGSAPILLLKQNKISLKINQFIEYQDNNMKWSLKLEDVYKNSIEDNTIVLFANDHKKREIPLTGLSNAQIEAIIKKINK